MNEQSSWLADGVKEIERITRAAVTVVPQIIKLPDEKSGVYGVLTPGSAEKPGTIEQKLAGPGWHNEHLETPGQLIAFIESLKERTIDPAHGVVYVGRDAITFHYDFEDRRHRAIVPLKISKPWTWLSSPTAQLDQKSIIRTLRITFAGALPQDSNLVSVLRNVKWSNNGEVEGNMQRGMEAIGKKIMSEASGISNFPEDFRLNVPVFENVRYAVSIGVALEILPDVQRFEIIPFPNQLQIGMENTLDHLVELFEPTGVPTFIGSAGKKKSDE